jgi:hypothetical protein
MHRTDPHIDIIMNILQLMMEKRPDSGFVKSLHQQYCERGGLSKRQLEGLYSKASGIEGFPTAKLATLEAIIKKKHSKERTPVSKAAESPVPDIATAKLIDDILTKYPQHKMVVLLRSKFQKDGFLSAPDADELKRLGKILLK